MGVLEEFRKYRERRIRLELSSRDCPDARQVEAAVDRILAKARRAGIVCGQASPKTAAVTRQKRLFGWP